MSDGRSGRRAAIWAMLIAVVAALAMSGSAGTAHAEDATAVDVYGGCLVAKKAGDLQIIIDESASLDANDPDNARIASAKYLLTQLNSFAERAKVTLDVNIAGFSDSYDQVQDWTKLDDAGLATSLRTIDSFADRPYGFETDYWMALEGARRSLAEHNPQGDRCQALVWVTDGGLDIDWRRTAEQRKQYGETKPYLDGAKLDSEAVAQQAEAEAERQICRDGGLADQLRSSKITIFAVGLRGKDKPDYTLMRSIALGGDAGGQHCGRITDPPGNFTEAANIDQLLFEFDKFSTPNQEKKTSESGVCQGEPCPQQRHTFVLDDSIQSVHILGSSDVDKAEVYLVTPSGQQVKLTRKGIGETTKADTGGVSINYSWQSTRTIVIDMSAKAGTKGWAGPWSVVFVDPTGSSPDGKSRTSIAISGDVFPTWPQAKESRLRAGEPAQLQLGLVNADGDAIDPTTLLGTVAMDVSLLTADGTTVEVAKGLDRTGITQPVTLDLTDADPGEATLVLQLRITTADAKDSKGRTVPGTELQPQTVRIPVRIEPPPGYPTVAGQVNFGKLEGIAENAPGTLPVTGPGCVWVEGDGSPTVLAGPEDVGQVSITSEHNSADTCLEVGDGQTAQLPVQLTTTGMDNGTLNAEFQVMIMPTGEPDRAQPATATATANFVKPLNPVNFTLTLIVAAILGPGIPIGLLYLMKYLTSKIPGRALIAEEYPVAVAGGQVLRDGQRFDLRDRDLASGMVPLSNSGSRTARAGSVTLQARMGASPIGQGHVEVVSPGRIGASSSDTRPHGKDLAAHLPLAVHNHWVVLHDPQGPPDRATVLLLVGAAAPQQVREKLVDDVNSRVPEVLASLRAAAGVPTGPDAAAAPFGGDAGPQPPTANPFAGDVPMPPGGGNPFGQSGSAAPPATAPPATAPSAAPFQGAAPQPAAPVGQPYPQQHPPTDQPPTGQTPTERPPAGPPPTGQTPTEHPPTGQPPTGQTPTEQPPTGHPPTEQQATGQPPTEQAPEEGHFRPAAPPPGTQIRNPFEFGDNSGR